MLLACPLLLFIGLVAIVISASILQFMANRFAGANLTLGHAAVIGFFIFLRIAKMPTQAWYFLPLTTFAAVCIDAALGNWPVRWQPIPACSCSTRSWPV